MNRQRWCKRALVALMVAALLLGALCGCEASGDCGAGGNNLTWETVSSGYGFSVDLYIRGSGAMRDYYPDTPGPWEPVSHVSIEDGVTSIGAYAFYEHAKFVEIPDSVERIGDGALAGVDSLSVSSENDHFRYVKSCLIEKSSKTLRWGNGKSVIPDDGSVEKIDVGAFSEHAQNLRKVAIPTAWSRWATGRLRAATPCVR